MNMTYPGSASGSSEPGSGEFLAGMRRAAASVCIVTTGNEVERAGITVSSMTSVSTEPPAVLVCVKDGSHAASAISKNGRFCVNLLREDQSSVSDIFAGRGRPGVERFACAEWTTAKTGGPALGGAVTVFDCRLAESHSFGTHLLFIGRVVEVSNNEKATSTLVYHDRAYCRLSAMPSAP